MEKAALLAKLKLEIDGFDPITLAPFSGDRDHPINVTRRQEALRMYHEIQREQALLTLEREKLAHAQDIDHRRLDIEEDRVQVAKAEVVVKALEVAVKGGVHPDKLLETIKQFSQTLLTDRATKLLEDKTK